MSVSVSQALNADSSEDEGPSNAMNADSSEDEVAVKSKKFNADSSEDELAVKSKKFNADSSEDELAVKSKKFNGNADSSEDETLVNIKKNGRKSHNNIDSSDDEGISLNISVNKAKVSKPIIDSDESDDKSKQNGQIEKVDADSSEDEDKTQRKKTSKRIQRKVESDSEDSGPEVETPVQNNGVETPGKNPLLGNKDLYDAESSDDDKELPNIPHTSQSQDRDSSENEDNEDSLNVNRNKVVDELKDKKERKSAQDAMMEIRSASSRLLRESAVGLPYHRPKQRSLAEFLNRKKGTPDVLKSIKAKTFDSSADKVLEEREKKMKEFYKSDTDGEDADDEGVEEGADEKLSQAESSTVNQTPTTDSQKYGNNERLVNDDKITESVIDSQVEDSGILSGLTTSDESNQNTDEEKSAANSPMIHEIEESDIHNNQNKTTNEFSEKEDSLKLVLETETLEQFENGDSLKLVLETDSLEIDEDIIPTSQGGDNKSINSPSVKAAQKLSKLELLRRAKFDVSKLENSLNITPKISEGLDDDLIIYEKEEKTLSLGANKLFQRFVSHAKSVGPAKHNRKDNGQEEDITVVTKNVGDDGKEILESSTVKFKSNSDVKEKEPLKAGASYISLKAKLKQEMFDRRLAERVERTESAKSNQVHDDLPDEEEIEGDYLEDEEEDEDYVEDEEGESEPEEEDDMDITDKKHKRNVFEDDEAEDDLSDDDISENEDDNDSVNLDEIPKKSQFRKIIADPELLSEASSDIFKLDTTRGDTETPTLNQSKLSTSVQNTTAPNSTNSSICGLSIISTDPRWTPFQDRIAAGTVSTENSMMVDVNETAHISPTNSQIAKKKLGFEGLFDQTDPDVTDIDDVVGLCSGQFVTQPQVENTHNESLVPSHAVESQDTLLLTGGNSSRPESRNLDTQDTVIMSGVQEDSGSLCTALEGVQNILDNEGLCSNKDEDFIGGFELESDDEDGVKICKKRKRRLVSDSEDSDTEDVNVSVTKIVQGLDEDKPDISDKEENPEEVNPEKNSGEVEYDSDENEVPKKSFRTSLFDKKGKLKRNFLDAEAELSGSEEGSDDEDERGLDRLEMEEGDLDEIDVDAEKDKLGRIHQKAQLDQDQAELKLFQDRFLEDGDLHTDYKRQRQFKWSGLDTELEGKKLEENHVEHEEDNEEFEKWRMAKMEREKWMKEQHKENENTEEEVDSQFFQLADRTLQRMSSKEEPNEEKVAQEKVFKSPPAKFGPLQSLQPGGLRGSFLSRDAASFERLNQFNKVKDDVTGSTAKGRNFVFAAISPTKQTEDVDDKDDGKAKGTKKNKSGQKPPAKRAKFCRTLDENSSKGTIFNLL